MNTDDIKALYKMFKDTDISELEVQQGNSKVRIEFGNEPKIEETKVEAKPEVKPAEETPVPAPQEAIQEMKSKWVGFFSRINPKTGEYYVKLRDEVKAGDLLGHVRVLGVMQDVLCEKDGKLKEILVEDGQPIEFGQPLFRFES